MATEQTRISVGLTRAEYEEVHLLARRCNTSASSLGQLACRHMLIRAQSGMVPMLPAEDAPPSPSPAELLKERAAAGVAFWRDDASLPSEDAASLFGDLDFGRPAIVLSPPPEPPAPKEQLRISVGLTRDEFDQVQELAQRCNTSASALGQLAYLHLLFQARDGAIPMLPVAVVETMSNTQLETEGLHYSMSAQLEESMERIDSAQARINELDAVIELDRLIDLTCSAP